MIDVCFIVEFYWILVNKMFDVWIVELECVVVQVCIVVCILFGKVEWLICFGCCYVLVGCFNFILCCVLFSLCDFFSFVGNFLGCFDWISMKMEDVCGMFC